MLQLNGFIPEKEQIRNIIFDFGGVICNLDIDRTLEKFKSFESPELGNSTSKEDINHTFDLLVEHFETGEISMQQFRDTIRQYYGNFLTDADIDNAWNAMLIGIPASRIRLLEDIRSRYRIFLLSNTNSIHYKEYSQAFFKETGYKSFDDLFEKAWFSHNLGLRKPGRKIFDTILAEKNLKPEETLFIDDTLANVSGARLTGMHAYHLKDGTTISDLFQQA
ncbi:MAG: HAD family phosphatase [Bacteroidota bacterium]|nr:HAD family phosphatase [Bacteroidota bacterium]